jgi:putative transposase
MAFYSSTFSLSRRFRLVLSSFLQHDGLAFANVLPEENIQRAFDEENKDFAQEEDAVYTPAVTLWAFLSQVLFKGEQRSCLAAVSRIIVLLISLKRPACSDNTGAYCRARAKLPEVVLRRLVYEVADGCEEQLPGEWLWHGRHVYLVDGTTVSMPDTDANQEVYPQQTQQKKGIGFPIARLVVSLSLSMAMVSAAALGPYAGKETGESALLRPLLGRFGEGDLVLADRYYCSYFMICLLLESGLDFVVCLHQRRQADFRRGERLGKGDHLVAWTRPIRPAWMNQETYDRMPQSIRVREVQVHVNQPGFRTESLVVVSTLTDARSYTREDLAELYHKRWLAELDIRAIKISLGMDVLRCRTPQMVRREIWVSLLAYNLIRQTILEAAKQSGCSPRQLSFTAAMQKIAASWDRLLGLDDATAVLLVGVQLKDIAKHEVGNRPDRVEPRAVKRRPKEHALLMVPRWEARAQLLAGNA